MHNSNTFRFLSTVFTVLAVPFNDQKEVMDNANTYDFFNFQRVGSGWIDSKFTSIDKENELHSKILVSDDEMDALANLLVRMSRKDALVLSHATKERYTWIEDRIVERKQGDGGEEVVRTEEEYRLKSYIDNLVIKGVIELELSIRSEICLYIRMENGIFSLCGISL